MARKMVLVLACSLLIGWGLAQMEIYLTKKKIKEIEIQHSSVFHPDIVFHKNGE